MKINNGRRVHLVIPGTFDGWAAVEPGGTLLFLPDRMPLSRERDATVGGEDVRLSVNPADDMGQLARATLAGRRRLGMPAVVTEDPRVGIGSATVDGVAAQVDVTQPAGYDPDRQPMLRAEVVR